MPKIVGLSGGIGTGKSTVAALLEKLGATVIDADSIVRELQAPGSEVLEELTVAFGAEIIDPSGALDRDALGAIIFRDEEARARLEAIIHPRVGAEVARRIAAARETAVDVIVLDIPLLFEGRKANSAGASRLDFDATLLVYAPEAAQIQRQMKRDGCDREEALRRIRAQLPIEEKRSMADHVIDNSGTPDETERQVREFYASLTEPRR